MLKHIDGRPGSPFTEAERMIELDIYVAEEELLYQKTSRSRKMQANVYPPPIDVIHGDPGHESICTRAAETRTTGKDGKIDIR